MQQNLTLEQSQILSQRMIQSVEILQMNIQELETYINQIALENPVIELENHSNSENVDEELKKYQWLNSLNEQNHDTYIPHTSKEENGSNDKWNFHLEEGDSLKDYLWSQIISSCFNKQDTKILNYMLDCLDNRGYLDEPLEKIAERFHIKFSLVESLLETLQELDPAGVCARSLEECLLLQLKRSNLLCPSVETIIHHHLDLLAKNQISAIARKIKCPIEDTIHYCQLIKDLNPKPGASFSSREQLHYIIPSITLVKFEHHYEILLNEYLYPTIEISSYYKEMCKTEVSSEVCDYLHTKIHQAEWVKKCISQRNKTLLNVVKTILMFQEGFFAEGNSCLKPLKLQDVAQVLGIHESTVCRAIRQKYLQCSWGIYPLNYFFSKGVSLENGNGSLTPQDIKHALKNIIASEDKKKPFSDRILSEKLIEQDITISRRTVAKYRDELGIPDANGRKNFMI